MPLNHFDLNANKKHIFTSWEQNRFGGRPQTDHIWENTELFDVTSDITTASKNGIIFKKQTFFFCK